MKMRLARPADARRLAEIHYACDDDLIDSFMCRLGPAFLREYYEVVLGLPWTVVVCATDDAGEIVGFTSSSLDSERHFEALRNRKVRLFTSMVPALVRRPSLVGGVLGRAESVRRPLQAVSLAPPKYIVATGVRNEFMGILPSHRSGALAITLLQTTLGILRELGATKVWIEIDADNERMLALAKVAGAKVDREITTEGKRRYVLHYPLGPGQDAAAAPGEGISTRALRADDIDDAVQIHLAAFPQFFLSFLGPAFLRQLYRSFCGHPECVALVAMQSGRVVGVVVGTTRPQRFFRKLLLDRWWAFGLASVPAILRRPRIAVRLVRALRYRGDPPGRENLALLSSIAVDPTVQGRGVGRVLVEDWSRAVAKFGVAGCYLVTDAVGNESVNHFYQKLGWRCVHCYTTPEGRPMHRYELTFPAAA